MASKLAAFLRRYARSDLPMLPTLGVTWVLVYVFAVGWVAGSKALPFKAAEILLGAAFASALAGMCAIVARTALRTIGNAGESWLQRAAALLVVVLLGAALKALVS
ncbi:MAG: hypothetical protein EKK41_27570 [Hyphomicrobiales bacterium]|nr:MAG: hypothetical protein EKK41_27570 [Hyphomicrobiales bacterium]